MRPRNISLQRSWLVMESKLLGLLTVSVLCAYRYATAADVTYRDLLADVSNSQCTVNFFTQISVNFRYCAQDGVPPSKCGEYSIANDVAWWWCEIAYAMQ